jgi:hypothetical protein
MFTSTTHDYFIEKITKSHITAKDISYMILLNKNYECITYNTNRWIEKQKDGTIVQINIESIFVYVSSMIKSLIELVYMVNCEENIQNRINVLLQKINEHKFQKNILHFLIVSNNAS